MSKPDSLGASPANHPAPSPRGAAAGPAGPDAQDLLQQLPWGVVVLDAHGTVLRLNPQAAYWWGQPLPDVQGQPLNERTAGTLPADLQQALQRVTTSPEPVCGEFFLLQPRQWIAMTSARQGDDWVVYWQDITAQKQLEGHNLARQAASDALLRRTEAVARTGSYELVLAPEQFYFSDGLYRLFGEEPGAFVPSLALIDSRSYADDLAAVQQVLTRAIESRQPYYYQRRIYRPDGQLRTLECHGRVECDAQGQPVKLLGLVQDVTEREQAAQELLRMKDELAQRAADNYRVLYNSMDVGFCIVEVLVDAEQHPVDYRFLDVNPAFEKQTGLRGAQGRTMRELAPTHEQYWFDIYGRVADSGAPTRFEANGEALGRWFDVNAFPIGTPPNRHVGVLFTDITVRKQAEEALHQSEERLRRMMNVAHVGVLTFNFAGTLLTANDAFLDLIGYGRAEFEARTYTWQDFTPPEYAAESQRQFERVQQTGLGGPYEKEYLRRDGSRQWLMFVAAALGDGTLVEYAVDISAQQQARAALRVSEAKYHLLFDTMDQGFGIGEVLPAGPGRPADFRWLEVNPQVERLTGMPQAALLSGETMRTVMPELEDIWYERYERVALTGEPVRFEQHARVLGRWFDVYAYPLNGPPLHRVALLFTNITARKQSEEDLRHDEERHREQLEQQVAERTGALSESRHLLQTVFNASPTAIVVMRLLCDAAGQAEDFEILIFNEFNKQVVGRDDIVGQRFTAMFPQTVPTGILARLLAVATTGKPADFEQWYEGEGMRHWFRHIVVRQNDLLVLTSEVITARKLLEQAQLRSLALLQQSEAVAGMGSWEYDLRTQAFTWSNGLYHLLERPVGSAIKLQVFLDAVLDDDRAAAARLLHTLTTGASAFDTTLRLRIGAAVKTVRFKAVPLPDAPGPPERVLGVCLDVSDVQRLEAENLALKLDHHKELLLAILQAQEDERQRLGEVLHNGLGQILYATKLHLDQLDSPALHAVPVLSGLYRQTGRLLADAMHQTRTLAHDLVPTSLLDFGLSAAVRDVCRDLSTPQLRIACHVWDEVPDQALPPPVQVTLFRLAQELAHNIVRHAGATQATLELETLPGGMSLRAEDNGRGFDPQAVAEGLGLRTVRQAVALLGGTVAVDSSPAFGTHIRLRIPLPLFSQP